MGRSPSSFGPLRPMNACVWIPNSNFTRLVLLCSRRFFSVARLTADTLSAIKKGTVLATSTFPRWFADVSVVQSTFSRCIFLSVRSTLSPLFWTLACTFYLLKQKWSPLFLTTVSVTSYDPQVFAFGSVPLRTYLPDGDVDITVLGNTWLNSTFIDDVRSMLQSEQENCDAEFKLTGLQFINAEVRCIFLLVHFAHFCVKVVDTWYYTLFFSWHILIYILPFVLALILLFN